VGGREGLHHLKPNWGKWNNRQKKGKKAEGKRKKQGERTKPTVTRQVFKTGGFDRGEVFLGGKNKVVLCTGPEGRLVGKREIATSPGGQNVSEGGETKQKS